LSPVFPTKSSSLTMLRFTEHRISLVVRLWSFSAFYHALASCVALPWVRSPSGTAEGAHRSNSGDLFEGAPLPPCSPCTPSSQSPTHASAEAIERRRHCKPPRRRQACAKSSCWLSPAYMALTWRSPTS
jgi:hypothetical protein